MESNFTLVGGEMKNWVVRSKVDEVLEVLPASPGGTRGMALAITEARRLLTILRNLAEGLIKQKAEE